MPRAERLKTGYLNPVSGAAILFAKGGTRKQLLFPARSPNRSFFEAGALENEPLENEPFANEAFENEPFENPSERNYLSLNRSFF